MKELKSETVGDLEVVVHARRSDDGAAILLVATCGETKREHAVYTNAMNSHEYAAEQFEKDVEFGRLYVAREAAARERTRLMHEKFFEEEK